RGREPVHLDEELVQGAVVFIVRAVLAARATERVQLVNKNHAALLARFPDERADAVRAKPHYEPGYFRSGQMEERHSRVAGDGASEQRFTGAGRSDQKYAFRDAGTHRHEPRGLAQEVD